MTRPALSLLLLVLVAGSARAAWYDFNPAGCVDGKGMYHDVLSRCDEQGRQTMYDPDPVTYCHEATHSLNARIRNTFPAGYNAFYIGKGKCNVLVEPRTTLSVAAQYVNPQFRDSTFQLYFCQQAGDWEQQPLYILDEFSAYINGAQAARDLGRDPSSDDMQATKFCHFADCVVAAVCDHDPNYAQMDELEAFVDYQKKRFGDMSGRNTEAVAQLCCPNGQCQMQGPIYRTVPNRPQVVTDPARPQPAQPTGTTVTTTEELRQKWKVYIEEEIKANLKGVTGCKCGDKDYVSQSDFNIAIAKLKQDFQSAINVAVNKIETKEPVIDYPTLAQNIDVNQVVSNLDMTAIAEAIASKLPTPEQQAAAIVPHLPPTFIRVQDSRGAGYSTEYQPFRSGSYITLPFGPAQ